MTLAELRTAYNEACRNPGDLERFTLRIMPRVFQLLEELLDKKWKNTAIYDLADNCLIDSPPPKKHQPERYTGGR